MAQHLKKRHETCAELHHSKYNYCFSQKLAFDLAEVQNDL